MILDFYKESCTGKKRYATKKDVHTIMNRAKSKHGMLFREYHCNICNGWHVSTKTHDGEKLDNKKHERIS